MAAVQDCREFVAVARVPGAAEAPALSERESTMNYCPLWHHGTKSRMSVSLGLGSVWVLICARGLVLAWSPLVSRGMVRDANNFSPTPATTQQSHQLTQYQLSPSILPAILRIYSLMVLIIMFSKKKNHSFIHSFILSFFHLSFTSLIYASFLRCFIRSFNHSIFYSFAY